MDHAGILMQANPIMVQTYFEMGKQIVEQERECQHQAEYSTYILVELSRHLTAEFGKGLSKKNLELIRKFYIDYKNAKSPISQRQLCVELAQRSTH